MQVIRSQAGLGWVHMVSLQTIPCALKGLKIYAERLSQWIGEQIVLLGTCETRPQSLTRLAPWSVSFWNAISVFARQRHVSEHLTARNRGM